MSHIEALLEIPGGGGALACAVVVILIVTYGLTIRWIIKGSNENTQK